MSERQKGRHRGRPALSEEEIARMREHISRCALRLYRSQGYHAVSMRKLASEADCTVMTLYRYFESKTDILRYLWDASFSDLFDRLEAISQAETDPRERLIAVCKGYVQYWLDNREDYFLVFMSRDVEQTDVNVFLDGGQAMQRFSMVYQWLEGALGDDVDPAALNLKSQTLICALNGISHNLITISGFSWGEPVDLVEHAVEGILKA